MPNGVLTTDDLRKLTQYDRIGDVRRCLERNGIRYFHAKDGVWTTIDLVNQAGGLSTATGPEPYPADTFQ